jgi:very-short-patch-repair endonuclease
MKPSIKFNNPQFKPQRKKLRNQGTSAEAFLWNYLKQRKLMNRKFTRQKSIGNYIYDFYCHEEKLVIELDGEDHFWENGIQKDFAKAKLVQNLGIQIVRFENKWVFDDLEYVLKEITNHFKA